MDIKAGTIVVGIDGSPSSRQALAWAADQAVAEHRPLTLVHAVSVATTRWASAALYSAGVPRGPADRGPGGAGRGARRGGAPAPGRRGPRGLPVRRPARAAPRALRDAALVLVVARPGPVRSLLLGSVGVAVVRHAACPVVVDRAANRGLGPQRASWSAPTARRSRSPCSSSPTARRPCATCR